MLQNDSARIPVSTCSFAPYRQANQQKPTIRSSVRRPEFTATRRLFIRLWSMLSIAQQTFVAQIIFVDIYANQTCACSLGGTGCTVNHLAVHGAQAHRVKTCLQQWKQDHWDDLRDAALTRMETNVNSALDTVTGVLSGHGECWHGQYPKVATASSFFSESTYDPRVLAQ